MPSTILSYLHNNSFLSAQPHRICKHIVNAFKLRNIYVFETVSFLSQITVCMYIHTHTQLHVCFPFKKVVENVFSAKVTKLCTTHTHIHASTHRHAEASTQEQEFVIAYFFLLLLYAQFQTLAQRTQLLNLSIFTTAALLALGIFVVLISRNFLLIYIFFICCLLRFWQNDVYSELYSFLCCQTKVRSQCIRLSHSHIW